MDVCIAITRTLNTEEWLACHSDIVRLQACRAIQQVLQVPTSDYFYADGPAYSLFLLI